MEDKAALVNGFGQLVVRYVRDEMIAGVDQGLAGQRRDIYSQHLYMLAQQQSPETLAFVQELIPHIVDSTIAVFLQMFETHDTVQLHIRQNDGSFANILELTDGLEGEYASQGGWAQEFTNQRPDSIDAAAEQAFQAKRQQEP
jgi:antirestriction protein